MTQHSVFAASSLYRWGKLACPASAKLEAATAEEASEYAREGSAAHKLAEVMISSGCYIGVSDKEIISKKEAIKFMYDEQPPEDRIVELDDGSTYPIDKEMIEYVYDYVMYLRKLVGSQHVWLSEERVYPVKTRKDVYGTADFIFYDLTKQKLHVIDFKYGKGIKVRPENNTQLMFYALGAMNIDGIPTTILSVAITIYQPRNQSELGPVEIWDADPIDLFDFQVYLTDSIAAASEKNPIMQAGEWCQFCNYAGRCPALRGRAVAVAKTEFDDGELERDDLGLPVPTKLTPPQIGYILDTAHILDTWLKEVRAFAHIEAERGRPPIGWKLVDKRATRKWKDEAVAKKELSKYLKKAELFETKFKTPPAIEKIMGKTKFNLVEEDLVSKESSGTNLVAEGNPSDRVLSRGTQIFDDDLLEDMD